MAEAEARCRRALVILVSLASLLAACAPAVRAPSVPAAGPPEWRPGDRWTYEWKSGGDAGTKAVEVVEVREVNGVSYYVVKIGDMEHFYTRDLHWAGSARDSRVEARVTPPHPWFLWPLEVGRRWEHRGLFEERGARQQHADVFAVMAAETVEVPAGRFAAVKVVREGTRTDSDQYWFAPEVRWYVKWIGRRGDVRFEEQLREYQAAPRLIPRSGPPTPASKTN
ncbi:MAG: hypothetical protein ACREMB_02290 [Candidatus Rokuibacteriota bacterium]